MVSKRARQNYNVSTRLSAIQEGMATLEAKTRTPAPDGSDERLELAERKLALLESSNYRAEQERDIWDARYTGWGTTIERNLRFGSPSTAAEIAALANRKVVWFNTTYGWEESFYATSGTAGLEVTALTATSASGWYPIGAGPRVALQTAGSQSMTANTNFTNWSVPGTGISFRNGPAGTFVDYGAPGYVFTHLAGRYEAFLSIYVQNGTGTAVASFRANDTLSLANQVQQKPIPLLANYGQVIEWHFRDIEMKAGGLFFARCDAGSLAFGAGWSEMTAKYLGPPLVQA
ncbi:minor tail protein [Microbacterium phage Zooman]|nr:minor tail protein [Microbacterium phage Zooman]